MKKNKKSLCIEKPENLDKSINMYEFMEMPADVYVPKNSKLIGKTVDEIKKEFCIDNIIYYHPVKKNNIISCEKMEELEPGMKLKSGYMLVIGQWGGIKEFEETYDLNGNLRNTHF